MHSEDCLKMHNGKRYKTDFLFSSPSFWNGVGSVFNIRGNYYLFNYSPSGKEADLRALESDWGMVKQDFENIFDWAEEIL